LGWRYGRVNKDGGLGPSVAGKHEEQEQGPWHVSQLPYHRE
jgi:hypothetical protein